MARQKWKVLSILIVLLLVNTTTVLSNKAEAQIALKYGDVHRDVWDLQYRLRTIKLYSGSIDGHYGPGTKAAVIAYQKKYGMVPNGKTSLATWKSLKKVSMSKYEVDMMSKVIYGEARGESYTGQVAIGAVLMNRFKSSQFPNTMKGVIYQKNAFTVVTDGQFNLKPSQTAYKAALDAVRGVDPTKNALYYFNPKLTTSKWMLSRPRTVKIGNHIFAK
ncbi:cell wall hydrolase [Paenibacillus sp. GCM10028914]|uniref:cell wall hydrolase n=1 Tax=Paenibacillus sp. GCM10028914 TaxID=3273416 RepID=UPI0036150102